MLAAYSRAAATRPWAVATLTGGVMGFAGDFGAQSIEAARENISLARHWSWSRSATILSWSLGTQGVLLYEWFRALDARWPSKPQSVSGRAFWRPVFTKQVMHQVVTCPPLNAGFLCYLSLCRGEPCGPRLRADLVPMMTASVGYWGFVHNMNFAFVPPRFRILYMCCAQMAWTLGISLFGHRDEVGSSSIAD